MFNPIWEKAIQLLNCEDGATLNSGLLMAGYGFCSEVEILSNLTDKLEDLLDHPSSRIRKDTAVVLASLPVRKFECGRYMWGRRRLIARLLESTETDTLQTSS